MTDNASSQKRLRLVVCRGVYCNQDRRADRNFEVLRPLLNEINGESEPPHVKVEIASCLNMCGAGPNWIIYPDKIICNHVSPEDVTDLVEKFLRPDS